MRLMAKCFIVSVIVLVWVVPNCRAAAVEETSQAIPKIVLTGLDAYKANGAEAAMKAWLKGSSLEENKEAMSQASMFKQIESLYGPYNSYELVQAKDISKSTRMIYLVMNFQRGPVFARFVCYKADSDWIIPGFNFNTKVEAIFPSSMFLESK